MGSVFHRHGWDFQDKLSEEYGGVVRLYGMFKVCGIRRRIIRRTLC